MHEKKHQLRMYEDTTKQFAEANHLEYKSWVDNEVFDLIDVRKVKPKNYVTGRWVLTIKTDKQGQLLQGKGQMGTERFPGQAEGLPKDRFPCFHKTKISDEFPDGKPANDGIFFTLISKQPFHKGSLMM